MAGYARVMMGGSGIPAGMATAINGGVQTLAGAGTTQGTATPINLGCAFFNSVGSGTGGVLTAGAPGDDVWVHNAGANSLSVYPPTGAQINAAGTNTAVAVAQNTAMQFRCISATQWSAIS